MPLTCNTCQFSLPHLLLAATYYISHDLCLQPITLGSCTLPLHFLAWEDHQKWTHSVVWRLSMHSVNHHSTNPSFRVLPTEECLSIYKTKNSKVFQPGIGSFDVDSTSCYSLCSPCLLSVKASLFRNGGIFTEIPWDTMSRMRNPLSASIMSPGVKCLRRPDSCTLALSEIDPG